ncbi:palmitoyltransferase ZDHHC15A [Pygocentrus nattereri]|uniref:palmitoyltransferase ZDHHC15A n=1 Tax=Pygocentrus nattereri TaxID=42514 RepID=UPI00189130F1|nr:palmitoyltransferase ZDHHC15A [Pygocentrus nattereri]
MKVLRWVPVLIVTAVVVWSYYAYVIQLCLFTLKCSTQRVVYLSVFHVCFLMFCWCFWKTVSTGSSSPSFTFHLPDTQHYDLLDSVELKGEILDKMAHELPLHTRTATGAFRFCRHCQLIKPDRCHHCSACQICVLKMDHHCLWLNNCIGFSNYKFFLLFLLYSLLYCLCIVTTVTPSFIHLWLSGLFDSSAKLHVLFLTLVSSIFLVTLSCLLLFHCWLVANNKTTLEWLSAPFFPDGPDGAAFDVSVRENILQVFGLDWRLWLLPVSSSQGDGHSFPLRRRTTAHHPIMANGAECWEQEGIVVSQQGSPVSIAIDD